MALNLTEACRALLFKKLSSVSRYLDFHLSKCVSRAQSYLADFVNSSSVPSPTIVASSIL
jgi:hypothetical protein